MNKIEIRAERKKYHGKSIYVVTQKALNQWENEFKRNKGQETEMCKSKKKGENQKVEVKEHLQG